MHLTSFVTLRFVKVLIKFYWLIDWLQNSNSWDRLNTQSGKVTVFAAFAIWLRLDALQASITSVSVSLRYVLGQSNPIQYSISMHQCVSLHEATVPVGLLRPGRQCCHSAASAFRQPSATCNTSQQSQHFRPPCLFSRRPHSLELSHGFHGGPDHQCGVFQTFA